MLILIFCENLKYLLKLVFELQNKKIDLSTCSFAYKLLFFRLFRKVLGIFNIDLPKVPTRLFPIRNIEVENQTIFSIINRVLILQVHIGIIHLKRSLLINKIATFFVYLYTMCHSYAEFTLQQNS